MVFFFFTVRPNPPSNVSVTNTDEFYNITWNNNNNDDDEDYCLSYRVRIRESRDLSKVN